MLRGREYERMELDRLVDGIGSGRSGAVLIRGEPGAGKTALVDYVSQRFGDRRCLRARGLPSETRLPFAALHQLLSPAVDRIEGLPTPQRQALEGALGLGTRRGNDPFLIGVAVLTLLSDYGDGSGLVCLVDDAHWLDRPSLEALTFVSRRLDAEAVAIVIAVRDSKARLWKAAGLAELRLSPLDADSAAALLTDLSPVLAPHVRDRLVDRAAGNPLALVEFLRQLSDGQVTGRVAVDEPLAIDTDVERLFAHRVDQLPSDTRQLLLLVAAEGSGDLTSVLVAASEQGLDLTSLGPAEQADLVRVTGRSLDFKHPLVRSAIYQHATSAARREAHRALAQALATMGAQHADRIAWHLATAAVVPDESVARALEASADRALERGGTGAAVSALERAASLTVDDTSRGHRWLRAAELAWRAGYADQATSFLAKAEQTLDDPASRAGTLFLRGVIALRAGQPDEGFEVLLKCFQTGLTASPGAAVGALVAASEAASYTGDSGQVRRVRELALSTHLADPELELSLSLLAEGAGILVGDVAPASRRLTEVLRGAKGFADSQQVMWAGRAALYLGDDTSAHALYARAAEHARSAGAAGLLAPLLGRLAFCDFLGGRLVDAAANATEAIALGRDVGQEVSYPLVCLALVEAVRGEESRCRAHSAEVLAAAESGRVQILATAADWALGLLELGLGRPEEALDQLVGPNSHQHPAMRRFSTPDIVEAAARVGREDIAQAVLDEYESWATASPLPLAAATRSRCRGLLQNGEAAFTAYQEALAGQDGPTHPFHQARTQLLLGETLRRDRQRSAARAPLRHALDTFERLGAAPWSDRAATELRATGQTVATRAPGAVESLTSQEMRISRLASEGLSNREIAGQLFLSPRTVEYHLHKTFTKLSIGSRVDLIGMDLEL